MKSWQTFASKARTCLGIVQFVCWITIGNMSVKTSLTKRVPLTKPGVESALLLAFLPPFFLLFLPLIFFFFFFCFRLSFPHPISNCLFIPSSASAGKLNSHSRAGALLFLLPSFLDDRKASHHMSSTVGSILYICPKFAKTEPTRLAAASPEAEVPRGYKPRDSILPLLGSAIGLGYRFEWSDGK
jgi:hypothetical protein